MKIRTVAASAAIALAFSLAGCSAGAAPPAGDGGAVSTSSAAVTLKGSFTGLNGKTVAGSVTVTDSAITLAGFSSDEGPDLHLYLTNGTDEAAVKAGKQIAAVSFSTASQTFAVSGVDVSGYKDVVIHCDKAGAVFGAAPIS